jgi:hypothetical protein
MQHFQRAKSFTLFETYLYQKDERALPGNLQNRIKTVMSLASSPTFSLLFLSLVMLQRVPLL